VADTGRAPTPEPDSRRRWIELVGALFLAPAGVRLTLTIENAVSVGGADARGWIADLAVSGLVATAVGAIAVGAVAVGAVWKRATGAAVVGLWSLLHFANYEHISELGSVINILNAGYITDATFVRGSTSRPSTIPNRCLRPRSRPTPSDADTLSLRIRSAGRRFTRLLRYGRAAGFRPAARRREEAAR